jgi:hypothetical protein
MNVRFGEVFDIMKKKAMVASLWKGSIQKGPNVRILKGHHIPSLDEFVNENKEKKKGWGFWPCIN